MASRGQAVIETIELSSSYQCGLASLLGVRCCRPDRVYPHSLPFLLILVTALALALTKLLEKELVELTACHVVNRKSFRSNNIG